MRSSLATSETRWSGTGNFISSHVSYTAKGRNGEQMCLLSSIYQGTSGGYNVVMMSDLLHFHTSHDAILGSLVLILAKTPSARTYVAAGKYTAVRVCARIFWILVHTWGWYGK